MTKTPSPFAPLWSALLDENTQELASEVPLEVIFPAALVERRDADLWFSDPRRSVGVRLPTNLLERFVNARTDAALLKFAQRFGSLAPPGDFVDGIGRGYVEPME